MKKRLIERLNQPFCGEGRLQRICASHLTSVEDFYVLDHGDIPLLDAEGYRLAVHGLVRRPSTLRFRDLLGRFPRSVVHATMICAGNRRKELDDVRPIADPVLWRSGAVGHARWVGVELRAILAEAGIVSGAQHVRFCGFDHGRIAGRRARFGGSIPLERVLRTDLPPVLLAFEMNGRPLAREHGFPVRVVVPGFIGARSVKWLRSIELSDEPSDSPFFTRSHRMVDRSEPSGSRPLYEYPVNAAGYFVGTEDGGAKIAGYALAPAGDDIAVVELSADKGRTWQRAAVADTSEDDGWHRWTATAPSHASHVAVRATTELGRTMPESMQWNPGGYLYNAWARVDIRGENDT